MDDAVVEPSTDLGNTRRGVPRWLRGGFGIVVVALGIMWFVEILDTVALDDRLEGNGIQPRDIDGLDGIAWAPFLHGSFAHLISNTIPFVLLSGLALARGFRRYLAASLIIIGFGGALVWLLAIGSNENHVGASGWVFGLFGFVIGSALLERRPLTIIAALVAVVLYGGTILFGFLPRPGLSWEGHLFGLFAGLLAARLLVRSNRRTDDPELAEAA
ncbi:MAG: rhomboid family intramembrane serine protease [Acidimicrobiales bacterium]